ncbi:MAG TPA: hypothetical protein VHN38_05305 [Immundisolibacter sp.]|nr:hypothetical protein [Immundisolibacter sp.]
MVFNEMKGAMSAPAPGVHEPMVGLPATWYDQSTKGLGTTSTRTLRRRAGTIKVVTPK